MSSRVEFDDQSDDDRDVYYDSPTYPSKIINIINVVDASYYGNPLTRMKRRNIVNDSVMFKRGKSRAQDYRTIMIEKMPRTSSLFEIISAIRGDEIVSGQMLQTTILTGSLTARIIFREQKHALEFINFTHCNPLSFNGLVASVYLVATPTWPHSPPIATMGFTKVSSRCLIIRKAPSYFTEHAIRFWLEAGDCTNLEDPPMIEKSDTEIRIWFASEPAASRGFDLLSQNYRFQELEIGYRGHEHKAHTSLARTFFGIPLARKRNNRQVFADDPSERSTPRRKSDISHTVRHPYHTCANNSRRRMSKVSRHDTEDPVYIHDANPQSLSRVNKSDAKEILDALASIEYQCRAMKRLVGNDIYLMTTNDLQLRCKETETGISLVEVAQRQRQLIDCIEQLSDQLDRSTLIRKTLDDFYIMLTSALNFVHEYLFSASMQRLYMDVFDQARAFKRNAIHRPHQSSTCADIFVNNVQTTMQKLVSLASSIRDKGPHGGNNVPPKVEEKRKDDMIEPAVVDDTSFNISNVNVAEIEEEYESLLPTRRTENSQSTTDKKKKRICQSWLRNANRFVTKSRGNSK